MKCDIVSKYKENLNEAKKKMPGEAHSLLMSRKTYNDHIKRVFKRKVSDYVQLFCKM